MPNTQEVETAEVWRAAQQRRAEDLSAWFDQQRSEIREPVFRGASRAVALMFAVFVALASVSAVVHEGRSHTFVPKATAAMPAVTAP